LDAVYENIRKYRPLTLSHSFERSTVLLAKNQLLLNLLHRNAGTPSKVGHA
jgi:hypothetical protein